MMIERLQDVTNDIKAELQAASLKLSSPASNQIVDSTRSHIRFVSPSKQSLIILMSLKPHLPCGRLMQQSTWKGRRLHGESLK